MTDMDKLIAAVEAGTATMNDFASVFPSETAYGPTTWGTAHNAFSGSLDAALRLHEALLPGWRTGLRQHDEIEGQGWFVWLNAPNYRVEHYHAGGEDRATVFGDRATADANTPARAWLLAALKALKANTGTGGE